MGAGGGTDWLSHRTSDGDSIAAYSNCSPSQLSNSETGFAQKRAYSQEFPRSVLLHFKKKKGLDRGQETGEQNPCPLPHPLDRKRRGFHSWWCETKGHRTMAPVTGGRAEVRGQRSSAEEGGVCFYKGGFKRRSLTTLLYWMEGS